MSEPLTLEEEREWREQMLSAAGVVWPWQQKNVEWMLRLFATLDRERARADENQSLHEAACEEIAHWRSRAEKAEAALAAAIKELSCDGSAHRWDGEGECRTCNKYATDIIDRCFRMRAEAEEREANR